jgi:hypothetical protein
VRVLLLVYVCVNDGDIVVNECVLLLMLLLMLLLLLLMCVCYLRVCDFNSVVVTVSIVHNIRTSN